MASGIVQSEGPLSARVLWVGEAPGKDEVAVGRPFVGRTGQIVRRTLAWAGLDVERDVRFTNAVRHNPGSFPDGLESATLLHQYAAQLDSEIAEMPQLRVVVACGGKALQRLVGIEGVNNGRGWVLRNHDLPASIWWHPKATPYLPRYPEKLLFTGTLHPAGIMRSKGRDDIAIFRRDVARVKRLVEGTASRVTHTLHIEPTAAQLAVAAEGATHVYIDTEFNPETATLTWIGLTFDGDAVYGMPWNSATARLLHSTLTSPTLIKCAHNLVADAGILRANGVELAKPWWDTMIAHHALHPATEVGLDDCARFYIDDVQPWKDMDKADATYNALDVSYGWAVMQAQLAEAAKRPVNPLDEIKARMRLLEVTFEMEHRGMHVDIPRRHSLVAAATKDVAKLHERINEVVSPLWNERVRKVMLDAALVRKEVERLRAIPSPCPKHRYNGVWRQQPKACEICCVTEAANGELRAHYQNEVAKLKLREKELGRWEGGFVPSNPNHLQWLLYEQLKLPVQRDNVTKRPTTGRFAIDKLAQHAMRTGDAGFATVHAIKETQSLEKAIATFLSIKVGKDLAAHPKYKVHGTRTGRLAGGRDDQDERSDNSSAFNALNIPREWRSMYAARDGYCLVGADWRNVEGRLTAFFSRDAAYNKALEDELKGGWPLHAINAAAIFNIDPGDAKKFKVTLGGLERTAYDAGKRLTHAWSYGMKPPHMSRTFNIVKKDAHKIFERLNAAYPRLAQWRTELVERVLGAWEPAGDGSRNYICTKQGTRFLANPFGWQMYWWGVDADQANEVVAFLPQSTGASMWTRVAPVLEERYPVYTGTYDSFVLEVPFGERTAAMELLHSAMERPWEELDGRTFPCEVSYGLNWGEMDDSNPNGLRKE